MKVTYILQGEIYEAKDIEVAMQCAEAAFANNGMPVRVLVETQAQYDVLIGVRGLTRPDAKHFKYNSISGEIVTRKQFQGTKGEILIVICPTIELLQKVQQYPEINMVIVVPEMKSNIDIYHWLDIFSATDIQNGVVLSGIGLPADGIKRAIGYLMNFCMKHTVDMTHLSVQTGEMADVVNTIKKQNIKADYDEVIKYCILRGLKYSEAEVLAKAFCQKSLLKTRGCPNYDAYWHDINVDMWESMP